MLKQGLLSDPIDKTLTFFVVFAILGALSRRFVARFPQGEQAVGLARTRGAGRSTLGHRRRRPAVVRRRRPPGRRRRLPRGLAPPTPSPYHRLNPLTKAVIATVESLGAFVLGGYVGPLAIIVLAILPAAAVAGVARPPRPDLARC